MTQPIDSVQPAGAIGGSGGGGAVESVAGKTGEVTLEKSDITDFNEANYVHVTGNETVAGLKTFTTRLRCNITSGEVIEAGNVSAVTSASAMGIHYGSSSGGGMTVTSGGVATLRHGSGISCKLEVSNSNITLYDSSSNPVVETRSTALGGLAVKNGATGNGSTFERVLTTSDLGGSLGWNMTPPSSSTDFGEPGEIAYDSTYFYICYSTNSWNRYDRAVW